MTNPHTSDVTPETPAALLPLDLPEILVPRYSLGRAAEFLTRAHLRSSRQTALHDLCKAVFFLHRHILREARALGLAVYYSDHNPSVADQATPPPVEKEA